MNYTVISFGVATVLVGGMFRKRSDQVVVGALGIAIIGIGMFI
jgi:hypothetical protein